MSNKLNEVRRQRRKIGIRKKVFGTAEKPRLSVFRSGKHIYGQLVNDFTGTTVASANTLSLGIEKGGNIEAAKQVGTDIAKKAKAAGITAVAFDRNGFKYHGRIKALADGAREGGLQF